MSRVHRAHAWQQGEPRQQEAHSLQLERVQLPQRRSSAPKIKYKLIKKKKKAPLGIAGLWPWPPRRTEEVGAGGPVLYATGLTGFQRCLQLHKLPWKPMNMPLSSEHVLPTGCDSAQSQCATRTFGRLLSGWQLFPENSPTPSFHPSIKICF